MLSDICHFLAKETAYSAGRGLDRKVIEGHSDDDIARIDGFGILPRIQKNRFSGSQFAKLLGPEPEGGRFSPWARMKEHKNLRCNLTVDKRSNLERFQEIFLFVQNTC